MSDERRPLADPFTRERGEPHEMPRGMPALMAMLLGAVGAWGATYFWYEAGDLRDLLLGDGRASLLRDAVSPDSSGAGEVLVVDAVDGARVYASICQSCHQQNGKGVAGAFPPLAGSDWVSGDPRGPIAIVLQGLQGEIEVMGQTYNGVMPPFGEQLSNEEIAAVVSYVRSSWGNDAPSVETGLVESLRTQLTGSGMLAGGEGVRALMKGP